MFEHLLSKHNVLLDEVPTMPRQELKLDINWIGFVLQHSEPVGSGTVHGEEVGVVGFIAGIGGLAILFGGVGMKDADLDPGLGEGDLDRTVVASGPLDDPDHVLDRVPLGGVTHQLQHRLETRLVVLDSGRLQEHPAVEVRQHDLGANLCAIDTKDREMLGADGLDTRVNDTPGFEKHVRSGLATFASETHWKRTSSKRVGNHLNSRSKVLSGNNKSKSSGRRRGQISLNSLTCYIPGHALPPRDDFGMSHGRDGNGGHRFWWKSEGRNNVG